MSKYKKCISCRKKTRVENYLCDNQHNFLICESCLRVGMSSENGCNRLIELIRRENNKCQNQKLQNRNHTPE